MSGGEEGNRKKSGDCEKQLRRRSRGSQGKGRWGLLDPQQMGNFAHTTAIFRRIGDNAGAVQFAKAEAFDDTRLILGASNGAFDLGDGDSRRVRVDIMVSGGHDRGSLEMRN